MTEAPRAQLFVSLDMERCEILEFGSGEVGVFSVRCPGKATPNEDAAAIIELDANRGVLAVADGMGGGPAGERAAELAVQSFAAAATDTSAGLRDVVLNGLEVANSKIPQVASGAGTTVVAVEVDGDSMRPYHVGDSAALVAGQRGRLKLATVAHSPTGYAVEAGVMGEREALHDAERNIVSNVVGTPDMKIEIGPTLTLAPRDTLLLATDGVLDNLSTDEICELIRKGPLDRVMDGLATAVSERMAGSGVSAPRKPDDCTFVVYRPTPRSGRRRRAAVPVPDRSP